jgi:hypothetical protein
MRCTTLVTLVLSLLAPERTHGQSAVDHRWDHWTWGENNGWHFVNDTVTSLAGSPMPLSYRSVSLSDPVHGTLLFYGDLVTIWNADHQPFPSGLGSFGSLGSSPRVITFMAEPEKHVLIFFAEGIGAPDGGLWTATVDMGLANGLGDLVAPAVLVTPERGLKWCPIPAITTDTTWVLANEPSTGSYYAYPWTVNGPGPPVLAYQGVEPSGVSHLLKTDRSGTRVATNTHYDQRLDLFRFDRFTGLLSDTLTIWMSDVVTIVGIEFSPSGELLYVAVNYSISPRITDVLQFDLSEWEHAAVNASRLSLADTVPEEQPAGKVQLGPDDRIYVGRGHLDSTRLAVIMEPDVVGPACDYRPNAVPLSADRTIGFDVLNLPTLHWPIPVQGVGHAELDGSRPELLSVKPNPATDQVHITIPGSWRLGGVLRLFDALGALRRETAVEADGTILLHRENLGDGVYTLCVEYPVGSPGFAKLVFVNEP